MSGREYRMPAMEKTKVGYTARILYEDDEANTVGTITARAGIVAGFNTVKSEILADAELTAAMGDDPVNDSDGERYSATIKCHDPSGEISTTWPSAVKRYVSPPMRTMRFSPR